MKTILFGFILISAILTVGSCGPMNKVGESSEKRVVGTVGSSSSSKNNLFYVFTSPIDPSSLAYTSPKRGDNLYLIRFVHAPDLHTPSSNAQVSHITYWMPAMPEMGKEETQGVRQEDGSFRATLFFSMRGRWEVTLKIKDGEIEDEYVFETEIR